MVFIYGGGFKVMFIKVLYRNKQSRKDFERQPGFDPITFTFSEDSNYEREGLLEVVERQNFAGCCQQTLENKKFHDITQ